MSGLENSLFQLKFTSKQLTKQALRSGKEAEKEKKLVKKSMLLGNNDIARVYAQNAIRKENERINLIRLSSRLDAVASRIQTLVTMRSVSGNMVGVIKGMDKALQTMNLEKISFIMEKFESQFEDLDSSSQYYDNVTNDISASTQPQEEVDLLMNQVADEAGLELRHDLNDTNVDTAKIEEPQRVQATEEQEDRLTERLRALRN